MDWLLSKLIEEVAAKSANPLVRDAYGVFKADIDQLLTAKLGPRNRNLRPIRKAIKVGTRLYAQQRRRAS